MRFHVIILWITHSPNSLIFTTISQLIFLEKEFRDRASIKPRRFRSQRASREAEAESVCTPHVPVVQLEVRSESRSNGSQEVRTDSTHCTRQSTTYYSYSTTIYLLSYSYSSTEEPSVEENLPMDRLY